jgi:hypothetical protein
MEQFLGAGNGLGDYFLVLLVYAGLFVVMQQIYPRIDPDFRKSFRLLFFAYGIGIFIANYVLFRLGFMSFMPWLNNFFHTFIWIGLCLTFLYNGSYRKPFWQQFVLFAVFSYAVKLAEHQILGTWEFGNFFGIQGNTAYIIGWSLADGLTPLLSFIVLHLAGRFTSGLVKPDFSLFAPSSRKPEAGSLL